MRELIKKNHDEAEHHRFTKLLLSGKISKKIYADYLYNQHFAYKALEVRAAQLGILKEFPGLERSNLILNDLKELKVKSPCNKYDVTTLYETYVSELEEPDIIAHLYVRHMGDMFGGQMIKKVVPGSGSMYNFDNRTELIEKIRKRLDVKMADESNKVFEFAIGLFEGIANEHNIPETE